MALDEFNSVWSTVRIDTAHLPNAAMLAGESAHCNSWLEQYHQLNILVESFRF